MLGLTVGALDVAAQQQIELLISAAELDVGADRDRVIALEQRIEQLEDGDRLARRVALLEIVALQDPGHGGGAQQGKQLLHPHVQPLPVEADLEAVGIEDLQRLIGECLGVGIDLSRVENWPGAAPSARITHSGGVIADDQHDRMAEILEFAQFLQHHGEAEMDVRRGGIDAQLHAQGASQPELGLQAALGQAIHRVSGQPGRVCSGTPGAVIGLPGNHLPDVVDGREPMGADARLSPPLERRRPPRRGQRSPLRGVPCRLGRIPAPASASGSHERRRPHSAFTPAYSRSHPLPSASPSVAARRRRSPGATSGPQAAPALDSRRPGFPGHRLEPVRNDDGGRFRPAPAGEPPAVQTGKELLSVRR